MPTLSAPDLALLRYGTQAARLYLSVFKPPVILSALINEATPTPGQQELDYDTGSGTYSLIEAGQPVVQGRKKTRIKAISGTAASGTLILAENAEDWQNNAPFDILHDYPLFPVLPAFDAETGIFRKDLGATAAGWTYVDAGDPNSEPPPVCLVGVQAFVGWYKGISQSLSLPVSQSSDDATESSGGVVDITAGSLATLSASAWFGTRFLAAIPRFASISTAALTVNVIGTSSDDPQFNLYAEDADNAPTFTTGANDLSTRSRTTAFSPWSATGTGAGLKVSPDISPAIQEVVNRPGWESGNGLAVIWDALASINFSITSWDGSPTLAPTLNITFTENVVFDLDLSGSYAVAQGATIASYSASAAPAAGITIDLNTGTGIGTITCTAAGKWWVKFGVTDSNGKTQYTYRAVMTEEPYRDFTLQNLSGDWDRGGWSYGVELPGSVSLDDFPDDALAVLWYENYIDGTETYINIWTEGSAYRGANILCAGYITGAGPVTDDYNLSVGGLSLTVESPESLLESRTPYGSIELEATAAPAEWYQYATWLTVGRAIHHLLKWHSTAFEVMEIRGLTDNTFKMRFATFTEASLLQRANNLAWNNGILAKLVSDRLGRLHLVRDSQLLGDSDRAGLDIVATLETDDISAALTLQRQSGFRVVKTSANGFTFDGTASVALLSLAPGEVPENQGTGRQNRPGQVLEDQTDLNERAGRLHAVANADLLGQQIDFPNNYLGALDIVPSLGFYEIGLADSKFGRNLDLEGRNLITRSISHNPEYSDLFTGTLKTSATFEFEVIGFPDGQTDTYPGYPECPPGAGTSERIEDDPTPGDELEDEGAFPPVALMAFSSANYRLLNGVDDWASLAADSTLYGTIDKYWVIKANSYDPVNLITWISGAGYIKELAGNASPIVTVRTPASAPPDTWSDTPDPAAATCSYIQVESDWYNQDEFYTLAQFQNGSSLYRGWVGKRLAGNTFSWLPLYDTGGALPDQSRPIFMAITCTHVLVTCWQDLATDGLKLLVFTKSPFAFSEEVDLGACTATQLNDRELLAFPAATPDYSASSPDAVAPWYVAGRMEDPAGLTGVAHILQWDGATWTEVSLLDVSGGGETWDTDYCGALVVGPDDPAGREYWAVRLNP